MTLGLEELVHELHSFAEAIGIDALKLQQHESPKKIRFTNTDFPAQKLRSLDEASIDGMQSKFGRSFSLRCSLADLPVLKIDDGSVVIGLNALRDATDKDTLVNIVLEVDKQALLASFDLDDDAQHTYSLFFYSQSLERLLESGLSDPRQLESSLWSGTPRQAIVLLSLIHI